MTAGSWKELKGVIVNLNPTKTGTVTVAGKPSVDVPPGTLNAILKQSGLKK